MVKVGLSLALSLGACHRPAPDSPEYQKAFDLYTKLYAEELDDSYGNSQMKQVTILLNQVDPGSSRAAEAKELKAKIAAGTTEYEKQKEALAAEQKTAEAPTKWAGPAAVPTGAAPPSPTAGAAGPALGMTRDDFLARFSDCFELKGLYQQGGKQGEAYTVKTACAPKYPALNGSLVVLLDNQVSRLIPLSEVTTSVPDAGRAETPAAPPPPQPKVPPPPPPEATSPVLPGMPHPVPAAPPASP
jgi:hypothetical protein